MVRLYATGTVGSTNGMKWIENPPAGDDFDADNDGVMAPIHYGLIDLSDLASQMLGQQVSQSATYKIRSIRMMLKNVDDLDDNDEGNWFAGTLRWWYPTEHRMKALSLVRDAEKWAEGKQYDGDSYFLRTEDDYRGLRVGWTNTISGVGDQVRHITAEDFANINGTEWNLETIFDIYNQMFPATKANSLFGGRAGDMTCKIPYTVANASGIGSGDAPAVLTDFNSGPLNADCCMGLIAFTVADSGGDESGSVDDDYRMVVSVEFDVGVDA